MERSLIEDMPASIPCACRSLRRLIRACQEDVLVQETAATVVAETNEHDCLIEIAGRRRAFARELVRILVGLGGHPASATDLLKTMSPRLEQMGEIVLGVRGDVYAACASEEEEIERVYAAALRGLLPPGTRALVTRQHAEIEEDSGLLRAAERMTAGHGRRGARRWRVACFVMDA
jgi:uncharacterized protein (TIGR02284 family)